MLLETFPLFAKSNFTAELVQNGTYLSIHINDDHLIPPFEAGELWGILKSTEQEKVIREKELALNCEAFTNQTNDIVGSCSLMLPYNMFQRIDKVMVFKATGEMAARLNRYFSDSAYLSMQRNQVYISAYNTRRLFYFGINESLIQK